MLPCLRAENYTRSFFLSLELFNVLCYIHARCKLIFMVQWELYYVVLCIDSRLTGPTREKKVLNILLLLYSNLLNV